MLLCVYRYPYFKEGDCPFLRISCVAEAGRRWPSFFAMAHYSVWLQPAHFDHLASQDNQLIVGTDC